MSLVKLPYELIAFVVHHLDLADVYSLSRSCKRFWYLLHEGSIAKVLLETKAPETLEARSARVNNRHASELRRLLKRREAISTVAPFLAAVVGVAQDWIYENGVLCYIHDRQLRILDLHRSPRTEIVVRVRRLLNEALVESRNSVKYKFRLLYYSHDIISCIYTHQMPNRISWLVVFNARQQKVLIVEQLESTHKLFVRNNDKFLFYGTFSGIGHNESRNWVIKGYNIAAKKWIEGALPLSDFVGSDIGTTICFEILGGHFYGLSNHLEPLVEELDWTSYYTCFRFPLSTLSRCGFRDIEYVPRDTLWRRQHTDGPIDDRWSFLRLFLDETTSELKVVEARKEWLAGQSSAKRTYYTKQIVFGNPRNGQAQISSHQPSSPGPGIGQSAIDKIDPPTSTGPPLRDPHMVHPGDDGSKCVMFTSSKCAIRSYHSSCQTFVDLVNDPASSDPETQRIRIRGGSRRPWTPGELEERKRLLAQETDPSHYTLEQNIQNIYKHEEVVLWPPEEDSAHPDPALAQLYKVLSPPAHHGNIRGAWDERSMVYSTGGKTGPLRALVFVSWDPSIYLDGVVQYPGSLSFGRSPTSQDQGARACSHVGLHAPELYEGKGKCKDDVAEWYPEFEPNSLHPDDGNDALGMDISGAATGTTYPQWRVFEPPMYRAISSGYHFAHLREPQI
ncbi:hypothetical protein B0H66DRAFT_114131 [Apodospora peruviana]|uniref:F-box domain-containing protein n=1 Tax=Apodospora peruviana TaxID=516989 RepID=A0AAE0IHI4_9PEZI|nr:hypothetical protein B0H66DRAFT_114131 [Apodospora peruviana]